MKDKRINFPKLTAFQWLARHKRPLAVCVLVVTVILLVWYLASSPDIFTRLLSTSPWILASLLVLYGGVVVSNIVIIYLTVQLCSKYLSFKDSSFLSVYSSLINFFGPLQSGPGVRAVYLKTKLGLGIRDYTYAMIFYYFVFATISTSLLFTATVPLVTIFCIVASTLMTVYGAKRFGFAGRARFIVGIYFATVAQVIITALIYHLELQAAGSSANFLRSLSYTGSANLTLFVSITPGAIGIREAFLLFTQSLHGVSADHIVAAGILDRAFYIVFLVLLFIGSSVFHIKDAVVLKKHR